MEDAPLNECILKVLKSSNVHIKNEATVLTKINMIVKQGAKKLQVLSDFEFTLTKHHNNGCPVPTTALMLFKSKKLPEPCKRKDEELGKVYKAIEHNPAIPLSEKIDAMYQWYFETHENLQGHKFDFKELNDLAEAYCHILRMRTVDLFVKLKELDVPILIISSGIGDMIEEILKVRQILTKNVNIISNFLKIDGDILNGFKNSDHFIHPFNKNLKSAEEDYMKAVQDRKNIILMGDSLDDASMTNGINVEEYCILKIGFYYRPNESLSNYMDVFDIVLVEDQTMNIVLEIVKLIGK